MIQSILTIGQLLTSAGVLGGAYSAYRKCKINIISKKRFAFCLLVNLVISSAVGIFLGFLVFDYHPRYYTGAVVAFLGGSYGANILMAFSKIDWDEVISKRLKGRN
jgi:hypothetical protein